jgi:hypothetical protein
MIKVGAFCIDSTEVTNAQYKPFVDDPSVNLLQQPDECKGVNDSFIPSTSDGGGLNVTTRADHPVVNVDWCDASAYCRWAGKRLCGAIGGGPLQAGAAAVPGASQWAWSCTLAAPSPIPTAPPSRPACATSSAASSPSTPCR